MSDKIERRRRRSEFWARHGIYNYDDWAILILVLGALFLFVGLPYLARFFHG